MQLHWCKCLDCIYCNWTVKINDFGECLKEEATTAQDRICEDYEKESSDE